MRVEAVAAEVAEAVEGLYHHLLSKQLNSWGVTLIWFEICRCGGGAK